MNPYENYTPEIPLGDDDLGLGLGDDRPDPAERPERERERVAERPRQRSGSARPSTKGKPASRKEERDRASRAKAERARLKAEKKAREPRPEIWRPLMERIKGIATSQNASLITGLILGGLGCWLAVAFLSYFINCIADQSIVNHTPIGQSQGILNSAGEGGARLSEFLINESFGLGSCVIIFWLIAMAMKLLLKWPRFKSVDFTIKSIVALITLSLIVGLLTIAVSTPVNWGGYHGRYVNEFIIHFVGWPGAVVVCIIMVGIFVVLCLRDLINWILRLKRARDARKAAAAAARAEQERIDKEMEEMRLRDEKLAASTGDGLDPNPAPETDAPPMTFDTIDESGFYSLPEFDDYEPAPSEGDDSEEEVPEEGGELSEPVPSPAPITQQVAEESAEAAIPSPQAQAPAEPQHDGQAAEKPAAPAPASAPSPAPETPEMEEEEEEDEHEGPEPEDSEPEMVVNVNKVATVANVRPATSQSLYKFPSVELLRPGVERISVDAAEQMENKEKIRKTLLDFDIPITSIEATVGPTITLYEIRPDRGVKIAKIRGLVDDLALSLSATGVRIIAPIPGKGTVGIEVANKDALTVSMQTVIKSRRYQESKARLPIALGSTIGNDIYVADLAKMPHLLVAGATGQGKSVGLNAIIASLLYRKSPHELKFVMIDPKMVEFSLYAKIERHYLAKVPDADDAIITDMTKVVPTLSSLCVEMDDRYQLLRAAGVRNLEEYNDKVKGGKLNPEEGHRFLPYIVVIVDEFADLIMTSGKEVEMPIARLAQKARAVGMHVIIATQRPSTNVITGIIKANFPVRMAFKVSSGIDSKTILDTSGAQQLIGRGDMLISNNSEMVRVQCAFIDTPEVEAICEHISSQPGGNGAYILPEPLTSGDGDMEGPGGGLGGGERDPLFEEAARAVVMSNTASTSSLQRRYSIGYNRAGKIMDQLEMAGIVGPSTGGKPRAVLVDPVTLEGILEGM